jgi:alpha-L-fucosidase 2
VSTEFPSFIIPTRGGGTEDFAIVPATISAMFLQSYQQNIHLFPNWPMDQDASFGNLAACGGFLISSQIAQGQVKYVQIQSNAGQECRLVNPWPKATIQGFSIRRAVFLMSGTILKFQTIPGEVFILEPHT